MAKKQISDDELNLRRKARRRLIGAIALTLAVVVIFPMVLDSEPKPAQPDIDLHIPDPDKVGQFIPSKAIPAKSTLPPVADKSVVATEAAAKSSNKATPPKTKKASNKLANPKLSQSKSKPKASAKKSASKADVEAYVAQVGAYSNANTAKKELAKLKKWGFVKAYTEKSGDTIRVRVGPYKERDKVEMVGKMLEGHGLKPVILLAK